MSILLKKRFQRGFGTFPLRGDALRKAVDMALEVGYRAFDTAQIYGNEAEVGEMLAACNVAREDLCITTKVTPSNYASDAFLPSVERSLRDLRLDCIDVLLLHWPPKDGRIAEPLKLLDQARREGLTRHIGISNFTSHMMHEASMLVGGEIATNQVEFHPLIDQSKLLAAAKQTGIPLSAYCAVARGAVGQKAELCRIGAEYCKSAYQIALRWTLQKGVSVISMSTRRENIAANFNIMDFALSSLELARIDRLTAENLRIVDQSVTPYAPEWD